MRRVPQGLVPILAILAAAGCQSEGMGRTRPPVSCTPDCFDRDCGEDGCGGTCGGCQGKRTCEALSGRCVGGDEGLVQGTLFFEYRPGVVNPYGGVDLDTTDLMPGQGMMAVVAAADGTVLGTREVKAEDGSFAVPTSRAPKAGDRLLLSTFWAPDDEVVLAVLQPPSPDFNRDVPLPVWTWSQAIPTNGRMGDVRIREDQGSCAMFIHLINRKAQGSVLEAVFEGNPLGMVRLAILWAPGIQWDFCGSCYVNGVGPLMEAGPQLLQTIFIGDEPDGLAPWSWPVTLHEFGHYVANNYSRDNSPGGTHFFNQLLEPRFAWSEGWASFFGAMTATRWFGEPRPIYWDVQSAGSFWIDFDSGTRSNGSDIPAAVSWKGQAQGLTETLITRVLWTLWTEKYGDGLAGDGLTTEDILRSVSSQRFLDMDRGGGGDGSVPNGSDLVDFLDSAACLFRDRTSLLRDLVTDDALGFPWDGDPLCPSTMGLSRGGRRAGDALRAVPKSPLRITLDVAPGPGGLAVRASVAAEGLPSGTSVRLEVRSTGDAGATGGAVRLEASSGPGEPPPTLEARLSPAALPLVAEARATAPGFGARARAQWPPAVSPAPRAAPARRPMAPVRLGPVTLTSAIPLDE